MKLQGKLLLILLAVVVFSLVTVPRETDWGDDYAQYISQAQSILTWDFSKVAEQTTFRQMNSSVRMGPDYYPWGFPLLICPVIALFGVSIPALQVYLYLFYAGYLVVLWHLFKNKLEPLTASLLVLLFAFNPYIFQFKRAILSDIPFLFFCTLLIYLVQRFVIERRYISSKPVSYSILGAVAFAGLFIRTVGVVELPLILGCQLVELFKERRSIRKGRILIELTPYLVIALLFGASHFAFRRAVASYSSQDVGGTDMASLVLGNLRYYLQVAGDFYKGPKVLQYAVFICTLPIMFAGIWRRWREDYPYLVFCVLYFGVVLIVPYQQGARYVFPLWPFYIYFLLTGAASIKIPGLGDINPAHLFAVPLAAYFAVVTAFFAYQTTVKRKLNFDGPFAQESVEMFKYVSTETPNSAVINCFKPRLMSLRTGRISVLQEDDDKLNDVPLVYTIVDKTLQTLPPQKRARYELVFSNARFDIYKKKTTAAK